MLDYSITPRGGYRSDDPEKLSERLVQATQTLARAVLERQSLREALGSVEKLTSTVRAGLANAEAVVRLGVEVLDLAIASVRPSPEMARALEAEAREGLQRESDEAIYVRRNAAVEQERRIKENELSTEIAVQEKQRLIRETRMAADIAIEDQRAELIQRRSANEPQAADTQAYALSATLEPVRSLDWRTLMALSAGGNDPKVLFGLACRELAENAGKIAAGDLVVVTLGQDGLVANTAKYAGSQPIVAVNPDPARFDGILMPFALDQVRSGVERVLRGTAAMRPVTLAEATLTDGQRLLAFNDVFVGARSHVSARYRLHFRKREESQSSSGVLVSTGVGSTGWMSSVFRMAEGVAAFTGGRSGKPVTLAWEDPRLLFAVREPFVSRQSQAGLVAGLLETGETLVIESRMPSGGVIFSDGMEQDFLEFNAGATVQIHTAAAQARLVLPKAA